MKLFRILTYAAAAVVGVCATIWPEVSTILAPIAAGLAGWATKHPADSASKA